LHLDLLGIWNADELELGWWLLLVKTLSISGQLTHPPEASATGNYWCSKSIEQIRHIAVHRLEYDTRVVRYVVNLASNTNNSQLTSHIEQVLKSLYEEECDNTALHLDWLFGEAPQIQPNPLSEDAKSVLDTALGLSPSIPGTPHEVLGRLECILNNVCFNYAVVRNEPWKRSRLTEPRKGELHHWSNHPYFDKYRGGKFASEFETCIGVRHSLEHKYGHYTDLAWLADTLRDSKRFATAVEDSEASKEVGELEKLALPSIEAQFAARSLTFTECSENELRGLANQAKQFHEKWANDYQLVRDDYERVLSRRYEESWRWYEVAADLKQGE